MKKNTQKTGDMSSGNWGKPLINWNQDWANIGNSHSININRCVDNRQHSVLYQCTWNVNRLSSFIWLNFPTVNLIDYRISTTNTKSSHSHSKAFKNEIKLFLRSALWCNCSNICQRRKSINELRFGMKNIAYGAVNHHIKTEIMHVMCTLTRLESLLCVCVCVKW